MTVLAMEKKIERLERELSHLHRTMRRPGLSRRMEEANARMMRETAGILRGKLPKDSVAWQRKVRAEVPKRRKLKTQT